MWRRFWRDDAGSMTGFFGLLLVALLGFAALVSDAGLLFVERRHLQNAADAAALAGAQVFLQDGWVEADVQAAVQQWAEYNGLSSAELVETSIGTKSLPAGELPTVTVRAERPVNLLFVVALGMTKSTVGVRAEAGVTPLQPAKIWPWSIHTDTYSQLLEDQITNGFVYLKLSSQENKAGNFLPLALTAAQGAQGYYESIIDGFDGPVPVRLPNPDPNVFWSVPTETGNMAGPTEDGVEYLLDQEACNIPGNDIRCPLIGLLPVVTKESWDAANGKAGNVNVVDLPVFMVIGLAQDPTAPGGGKGHQVVIGKFLERGTGVGPTDPQSELQLFGVRLWN